MFVVRCLLVVVSCSLFVVICASFTFWLLVVGCGCVLRVVCFCLCFVVGRVLFDNRCLLFVMCCVLLVGF